MDTLPARHRLTRLHSDALLSLSEQLVQLERRFDAQGIVSDDSQLQEAVRAAVAEQVATFAHRIEELETLLQKSADEIEKLKEHVFPIDWDKFFAKRRAE